jgi:hypothetical protein
MGFFAGEEGVVLDPVYDDLREDMKKEIESDDLLGQEIGQTIEVEKDVQVYGPVMVDGKPKVNEKGEMVLKKITFAAKGILGRLLDASLYERGSALKPSMMQTLIYVLLASLVAFMMGMSYAGH